jgi:hypothetical protein
LKAQQQGKGYRARWALGSIVLHALLLTFAATRPERPAAMARALAPPAELEVDVVPLPVAADDGQVADATEPSSRSAPAAATARRGDAVAAAAADEQLATSEEAEASDGAEDASGAAPASSATAPRLGLAQLGLTGPNQFLDRSASEPLPAPVKRRVNVKKRLDRALAQGLHDQKTALGLGAGSPVMRSLEAAVYGSTAPLNGNALFTFIIDSDGKLVSSSLGDVSSDRDKWERVARQAAQALAQRQLPVPKGRSVRLTVAVTSHLELPSGADPGLEVRALGIPLKKGEGPRSTRIDILNPLNPTAPLSLMGDPADLGGKARRMVRSHVVSEELL